MDDSDDDVVVEIKAKKSRVIYDSDSDESVVVID
jgi:hypothetical protein